MEIPGCQLKRDLNLSDAVWMGLGSILGTGIFVSIGIAASISGPGVILAVALAAIVATCNALSAAQLAAAHSVSGGTYEYGYHFLSPVWGFLAGWVFLLAKSASAATAALGFAGYSLAALNIEAIAPTVLAFVTVLLLTGIILLGAHRTSRVNTVIVSITIVALITFVIAATFTWATGEPKQFIRDGFFKGESLSGSVQNLLEATALMFVAYTGYGRIATLAEEVAEPKRVIPKAIIVTLLVSASIYLAVAITGIGSVGADFLHKATAGESAPLTLAARTFNFPYISGLIAVGAVTAMLGVLLNLILGLSRVVLAMGRRRDLPALFVKLDENQMTPIAAVIAIGMAIALLTLIGSVKTTWSFSAFTVLLYYAITNAAALAVPVDGRIFPRWISIAGLVSCLVLVIFIERSIWISGGLLVIAGMVWFAIAAIYKRRTA